MQLSINCGIFDLKFQCRICDARANTNKSFLAFWCFVNLEKFQLCFHFVCPKTENKQFTLFSVRMNKIEIQVSLFFRAYFRPYISLVETKEARNGTSRMVHVDNTVSNAHVHTCVKLNAAWSASRMDGVLAGPVRTHLRNKGTILLPWYLFSVFLSTVHPEV